MITSAKTKVPPPGNLGDAVAAVPVQPRALDAEYEWLGYEVAYQRTWIPNDWPAGQLRQYG